ncbi:MAG: MazG-like family protein [bacterium]|nr:MazG-like family protein [bacterium]
MQEIEQRVLTHLTERGWDKLRPSDIAKSIMIEGAELLELFQWENKPLEEVQQNAEKVEKIKKELADVLIYALEMAVLLKLDTKKIIFDKLDYVAKKYPAELMRKNAVQGAGSGEDSAYWRIKNEYRKRGEV